MAFDSTGKRIATASSDHKIRIWEKKSKVEVGGSSMSHSGDTETITEWELTDTLHQHLTAVQRIQWADPEFGAILASSSYDKQVSIWEEVESKDFQKKQWNWKLNFIQKEAILDIKFAPKHWGLTLAIAVADGTIVFQSAKALNNLT